MKTMPYAALVLWCLLCGCIPSAADRPQPPPSVRVQLAETDKPTLDRIVFKNTGRVVLVAYWANWHPPCQRQFAHLKVLQDIYGPQGLRIVAVSLDNPQAAKMVEDFLSAQKAGGIINLISVYGPEAQSYSEFGIPNHEIPYYLLYDRMGNLQQTYSGTLAGIEYEIDQLIKQTEFDLQESVPK